MWLLLGGVCLLPPHQLFLSLLPRCRWYPMFLSRPCRLPRLQRLLLLLLLLLLLQLLLLLLPQLPPHSIINSEHPGGVEGMVKAGLWSRLVGCQ
jgi:hypothetical protein